MLKYLVGFMVLAGALLYSGTAGTSNGDDGERLLALSRLSVFKLVMPSEHRAGGTGFLVKGRSGRPYLLTNGHICEVAEGGYLAAQPDGSDRFILVRVIENSPTTDLCLVDATPLTGIPLEVAPGFSSRARIYVTGHPALNELTLAEGFPVNREKLQLVEFERDKEKCTGPTRRWGRVILWLGPMETCIRTVDAWNTSAVIFGGSSGSPVMNREGQVVGVIFAGDSRTNYGAMIPWDDLKQFLSLY